MSSLFTDSLFNIYYYLTDNIFFFKYHIALLSMILLQRYMVTHKWIGIILLAGGIIFVQLSEVKDVRGKEMISDTMRTTGILAITCAALASACAGYFYYNYYY